MQRLLILTTMLFFTVVSQAQQKILEGTPIKVKIINEISSRKSQVGDVVFFKLLENFMVDSLILIDTTAEVIGEVIEAEKARSLGRPGKLDFTINTVKTVDGQYINLRATAKKITGKNRTGGVVTAAVLLAPVALFIKGKDVTIEKDKEFLVFVDKDYEIKSK